MGLIREPLDVDFYVDPRPLTKVEEQMISDFIRNQKLQAAPRATRTVARTRVPMRKKVLA